MFFSTADFPYADTNIDEEDPVNVNLRSTTPYYVVEMFWLVDSQFYKTCVFSNIYNKIFLIKRENLLLKRLVPKFQKTVVLY